MENSVLGNALEGVPEEEEEEEGEEKPKDSNVDSTENIDGENLFCVPFDQWLFVSLLHCSS